MLNHCRCIAVRMGIAAALCGCGRTEAVAPVVRAEPIPAATNDQPPVDAAELVAVSANAAPAKSFPELERFAFTTLQFQRMIQLQERDVQRALNLSPGQMERFAKEGAEAQRLMSEAQRVKPEEREARFRSDFMPAAEHFEALIAEELDAGQQRILLERVVRAQRGAVALVLPGVPEHLAMTATQRTAIYEIMDENRRTTNFDNLNNPLELLKLIRKATVSRDAAEKQLTADQRKRWDTLLGK